MSAFIVDEHHEQNLGSKASHLLTLRHLNVPQFFVIPFSVFESFLDLDYINSILSRVDSESESSIVSKSKMLQDYILSLNFSEDFSKNLLNYVEKNFNNTLFSVRSSSSLEDQSNVAFAGQFDTYLNIKMNNLERVIKKCLASLYNANVIKYALINHLNLSDLQMNVIIQEMIEADSSGIIFTANPQGLLNETVIVNGAGLGNNVVEDKVASVTYYYNRVDDVYYYETQEGACVLDDAMIKKILFLCREVMEAFGLYLDIEYAIKDDRVYLLQVRPITSLNVDDILVLDNSNIVESYPGISLPLTDSFVTMAYSEVFKGVVKRLLEHDDLFKDYEYNLNNMVASCNGRMYYQISNWYTVIKLLPMNHKIIPIWQDMLGVSNKTLSFEHKTLSRYQKMRVYKNALKHFLNVPQDMKKLNENFIPIYDQFYDRYFPEMSSRDLVDLYDETAYKLLDNWELTLINDMYGFLYTGLLKKLVSHYTDDKTLVNKRISGISNIESMKPVYALSKLVETLKEDPQLEETIRTLNEDNIKDYLNSNDPFAIKLKEYIHIYGDRSLEELKLESKTFRSHPYLLIETLLNYKPNEIIMHSDQPSIDLKMNPLSKQLMLRFEKKASLGIKNREISRLNRTRMFGIVRLIFMHIADEFYEKQMIEEREDIFYLTYTEVFACVKDETCNLKSIIEDRKEAYHVYRRLPAYSRMVFSETIFNKHHLNVNEHHIDYKGDALNGIPCSQGIVEAEVLVVTDPTVVKNASNKILVTKMTDPGWVFLLTQAVGIIAEKGSLLSHTAIVSRELKIPSVVGVKKATSILKTGDVVQLNGETGMIKKVR